MLEAIKKWEKLGYRIGIFPTTLGKKDVWTTYVKTNQTHWVNGEEGCGKSSFSDVEVALNAVLKLCEKLYAAK